MVVEEPKDYPRALVLAGSTNIAAKSGLASIVTEPKPQISPEECVRLVLKTPPSKVENFETITEIKGVPIFHILSGIAKYTTGLFERHQVPLTPHPKKIAAPQPLTKNVGEDGAYTTLRPYLRPNTSSSKPSIYYLNLSFFDKPDLPAPSINIDFYFPDLEAPDEGRVFYYDYRGNDQHPGHRKPILSMVTARTPEMKKELWRGVRWLMANMLTWDENRFIFPERTHAASATI